MSDSRPTAPDSSRIYWRSLEQLASTPEYRSLLEREFPEGAEEVPVPTGDGLADKVSRRRFLGLIAAAVAFAGATSCRKPFRKILPFARRPHGMTPGIPRYYATALVMGGLGQGILVRSNDGRPTKVEGNELHPASLGGSDHFMQAEILNLYDPARSHHPQVSPRGGEEHEEATWEEFASFWKAKSRALQAKQGAGLAFLLPPTTSPSLLDLLAKTRNKGLFTKAGVYHYEPLHRDTELAGAQLAFADTLVTQYRFDKADVVVALDCDFTCHGPNAVRHARDWASRRQIRSEKEDIGRLYAVEATYSTTGAAADHRFLVPSSKVGEIAIALAAELGLGFGRVEAAEPAPGWVAAIARDLKAHPGRSIVTAGPRQPALVHALAHAINAALDNVGKTMTYTRPRGSLASPQGASIAALAAAIDAGQVDTLVCLGTNPAYHAPVDLEFASKLERVPTTIHLGAYQDETGRLCDWHLNEAHALESWGDVRGPDGTVTIQQPLIAPLWGGKSVLEVLALLIGDDRDGYKIIHDYWQDRVQTEGFDAWWNQALHDGLVADSADRARTPPAIAERAIAAAVKALVPTPAPDPNRLEAIFAADHCLLDGRHANNAWMQEMPDSMTKLTWDNAALTSRKTAKALGVRSGDVVKLLLDGRSLEMPVWVLPGHADFCVTLPLGYGRRLGPECEVAQGAGFDTFMLRGSARPHIAPGMKVVPTGARYELVSTQDHGTMEHRALAREGTLEGYRAQPDFAPAMSPTAKKAALEGKPESALLRSLWPERDYSKGYQWGMVIDLNSCNGCNACVVACQAENNIPSVGKEQVKHAREMHWIRVDRYFSGEAEGEGARLDSAPATIHQPVPCMQCENAPCEVVCPVLATSHSPEGLNDMAYNRCIGTRYCSNNCPFKVRRFNWFDFTSGKAETLKMAKNPDVTVRSRGVMEKCTYCVQRIDQAKISARKEDRTVRDGEIAPACAQSCPSRAITFGNINDPQSRVSKLRASNLNYAMLSEFNVKPRTTYLAKIRNPNPELA